MQSCFFIEHIDIYDIYIFTCNILHQARETAKNIQNNILWLDISILLFLLLLSSALLRYSVLIICRSERERELCFRLSEMMIILQKTTGHKLFFLFVFCSTMTRQKTREQKKEFRFVRTFTDTCSTQSSLQHHSREKIAVR